MMMLIRLFPRVIIMWSVMSRCCCVLSAGCQSCKHPSILQPLITENWRKNLNSKHHQGQSSPFSISRVQLWTGTSVSIGWEKSVGTADAGNQSRNCSPSAAEQPAGCPVTWTPHVQSQQQLHVLTVLCCHQVLIYTHYTSWLCTTSFTRTLFRSFTAVHVLIPQ